MKIVLQDIRKHYGEIRANDGINMEILPGRIHGILGENGAGKSTLMKILAGYIKKTSGTILIDGRPANYTNPAQAAKLGIGMLYQDPLDFPALTVLENYLMGQDIGLIIEKEKYHKEFMDISDHFGFQLDPDIPVSHLSIGERQQLELLRLLASGVDLLILDEPTTGISEVQKEILFKALRKLINKGKSVLLVSHKLEDVESLCDIVTVLRQGKVTGEMESPFDTSRLLQWMFGTIPPPPPTLSRSIGKSILKMVNVSAPGGRSGLHNCHIEVKEGEIVGLAGLEGSGQAVFLRVASGLQKPKSGNVLIYGKDMANRDYHAFKNEGVYFLPAARLEEGLIPGLTLLEHFALKQTGKIIIPWDISLNSTIEGIKKFKIVGKPTSPVESLSGGNQQKLLLSLISHDVRLLLLENPTRGLDIESGRWVWELLMKLAKQGCAIIFSSPDIDEIFQVADRVVVFFNGEIVKDENIALITPYEIGKAIAGRI